MSYLIKPKNYKPLLDLKQTELGIKQIKEFFQLNLSSELRLRRVTAPLFVLKGMGINDDLNGIERPVSIPKLNLVCHKSYILFIQRSYANSILTWNLNAVSMPSAKNTVLYSSLV